MNETLDKFLEYLQNEGKAKNTISAYKADLVQFFKEINELSEISTLMIEKYKEKLMDSGVCAKTVNRKLMSIKTYLEWINASGGDIKAKVKLFKIQKQEFLGAVVTPENIEKMVLAAKDDKNEFAVAVFYFLEKTGCRVSELLQIKVKDIGKSDIEVMGKGKIRSLFPPQNMQYILSEFTSNKDPDEYLFSNPRTGKPVTRQCIDQIIKKYAKTARVKREKAHAHSFRHQYGIKLSADGVKIENIAEIMGHGDINTTRIYTREGKASLINQINKLYSGTLCKDKKKMSKNENEPQT